MKTAYVFARDGRFGPAQGTGAEPARRNGAPKIIPSQSPWLDALVLAIRELFALRITKWPGV